MWYNQFIERWLFMKVTYSDLLVSDKIFNLDIPVDELLDIQYITANTSTTNNPYELTLSKCMGQYILSNPLSTTTKTPSFSSTLSIRKLLLLLNQRLLYLQHWCSTLQQFVLEEKSLHELFYLGYEELKHPLILFDQTFKIVQTNGTEPHQIEQSYRPEDIWSSTKEHGYISKISKEDFTTYQELEKASSTNWYYHSASPKHYPSFLVYKIKINKDISFYLHVMDPTGELETLRPFIISEFVKFLTLWLKSSTFLKEHYTNPLLSNLLNSTLTRDELIHRANYLNWDLSLKHSICVVSSSNYHISYKQEKFLISAFKQAGIFFSHVTYENHFLVLLHSQDLNYLNQSIFPKLLSYLEDNSLRIGISDELENLLELKKYYTQARKACNYALYNDKQLIVPYDSIKLYTFYEFMKDFEKEQGFIPKYIQAIIEYDNTHKTSYLDTLFIYFKENKQQTLVANILNINRSTLLHRLSRIKELFQIDLDRNEVQITVLLTQIIRTNY